MTQELQVRLAQITQALECKQLAQQDRYVPQDHVRMLHAAATHSAEQTDTQVHLSARATEFTKTTSHTLVTMPEQHPAHAPTQHRLS